MKTPRFEELAQLVKGRAELYFVYSREAHPQAASAEQLGALADQLMAMDRDGDGQVTLAEYRGPRFMFDAFDLDHDGVVRAHELLAARRIGDFREFAAPHTLAERTSAARRFRTEVPGAIPVLVDEMDNRVGRAYGALPNSAFVIGADGRVKAKMAWAAVSEVQAELSRLLGALLANAPAALEQVEPAALAAAGFNTPRDGRPLLVEFTSPGCPACRAMAATFADSEVHQALGALQVAHIGVERDRAWALFESLGMAATPAYVLLDASGRVFARAQGRLDKAALLELLRRRPARAARSAPARSR
jgi:thiol-disulfide isomerase/thioredoxin